MATCDVFSDTIIHKFLYFIVSDMPWHKLHIWPTIGY